MSRHALAQSRHALAQRFTCSSSLDSSHALAQSSQTLAHPSQAATAPGPLRATTLAARAQKSPQSAHSAMVRACFFSPLLTRSAQCFAHDSHSSRHDAHSLAHLSKWSCFWSSLAAQHIILQHPLASAFALPQQPRAFFAGALQQPLALALLVAQQSLWTGRQQSPVTQQPASPAGFALVAGAAAHAAPTAIRASVRATEILARIIVLRRVVVVEWHLLLRLGLATRRGV